MSWESLGSPPCAPLALVCPLRVLLELLVTVLAVVLAPRSVPAKDPGWEPELLALLLMTEMLTEEGFSPDILQDRKLEKDR